MQSLSMLKKEKENENSQLLDDVERAPLLLSCRALLAAVMLLASCIVYMQKIDMSIGIVCMLNYTALNVTDSSSTTSNSSSYDPKCMFDGNSTQSHVNIDRNKLNVLLGIILTFSISNCSG